MKLKNITLLRRLYSKYISCSKYILVKIEKFRGLDFTADITLEELGLSSERSVYYGTANSFRIKQLLKPLKITKNDALLDYGSGKGKAIYILSKFDFQRVDGVEISKRLCDIAEKNLKKLNIQNFTIYNQDAGDFFNIDCYNYFYFFNPFPSVVMKEVLENIKISLIKNPRIITLIYFNPLCHDDIIEGGVFSRVKNKWNVSFYKNISP